MILKIVIAFASLIMCVGQNVKARSTQLPGDYFETLFQTKSIVYAGEYHSVADDKDLLTSVVEKLAADQTIGAIAFEFSLASDQPQLDAYISDKNVKAHSSEEAAYFSHLNRAYPVNFNNAVYDEALRRIKAVANKTGLKVCAVDDDSLDGDQTENGPRFKKLSALPDPIKVLMEKASGQSLTELAKNGGIWDREATMATNILKCAGAKTKTLVFVGFGHAVRYTQLSRTAPWVSAAEYTQAAAPVGGSVGTVMLGLAYVDARNSFPMFSMACALANHFDQQVAVMASSVPLTMTGCFSYPDPYTQGRNVNFLDGFDGVVMGPVANEISAAPDTATLQVR